MSFYQITLFSNDSFVLASDVINVKMDNAILCGKIRRNTPRFLGRKIKVSCHGGIIMFTNMEYKLKILCLTYPAAIEYLIILRGLTVYVAVDDENE